MTEIFKPSGKTVSELRDREKEWRSRGTPGEMKYVKKSHAEGGHWSYKDKLKVVQTYLSTGNRMLTSKLCEVPVATLHLWKKQPWWQEMIDELAIQEKVETNKTLKRIAEQSLAVVADRLTEGNHQYDQRSGEIIRVPVNARDAHRIAVDMMDAQNEIEKRIDTLSHRQEEAVGNDALMKLAEQLAKFAKGNTERKRSEIDVTDVVEVIEPKEI
jgi:hypothetical protein